MDSTLPINKDKEEDTKSKDDQSELEGVSKFVNQVPDQPDEDDSPPIITEEKLKCYEKFKNMPIIIEGPE